MIHLVLQRPKVSIYCESHPPAVCGQQFQDQSRDGAHTWQVLEVFRHRSYVTNDTYCETCVMIQFGIDAEASHG